MKHRGKFTRKLDQKWLALRREHPTDANMGVTVDRALDLSAVLRSHRIDNGLRSLWEHAEVLTRLTRKAESG